MATAQPLSPREEAEQLLQVYQTTLEAGADWAILDAKWFDAWRDYTGADPDKKQLGEPKGRPRPGPIDNAHLLDGNALKRELVEGKDYVLVHKDAWDKFVSWYGGGPAIVRKVISYGIPPVTNVELHPVFVSVAEAGPDGEPDEATRRLVSVSKKSNFKALLAELLGEGGQDEQKKTAEGVEAASSVEGQPSEKPRLWLYDEKKAEENKKKQEEEAAKASSAAAEGEPGAGAANDNNNAATADGQQEGQPKKRPFTPFKLLEAQDLEVTIESMGLSLEHKLDVILEKPNPDGSWPRQKYIKDWRDFEVGDHIDVKDTVGKWYESEILRVREDSIFIHYIGWASTWDEWIPKDSDRLAKKGTYTQGPYKGGSSTGSYYSGAWSWQPTNEEGRPQQHGAVGLRNLGNTCFMNSTLQCLSHTAYLTPFFLRDEYQSQINRTNPLGWKGRIADEYGAWLKQIWSGKYTVVAPVKLKEAIGEFAPRFSGYQQQDSQELLGFLLDGLHEDLNRVINKPMTQVVESKGRPDAVVAQEAWETYLKRNQSIVVDHVCGQLKSRVECLHCNYVSITFDPSMFLSVPLPSSSTKVQEVTFVPADRSQPLTVVGAKVNSVGHVLELKRAVAELVGVPAKRLVIVEVWMARVHRFFEDHAGISEIRPGDKIFAYEVPELEQFQDAVAVQVVNMKREANPNYNPAYAYASEFNVDPFGLPMITALPRKEKLTGAKIKQIIDGFAAPFRAPIAPEDAYTITTYKEDARYCRCGNFACKGCPLVANDEEFDHGSEGRQAKTAFGIVWADTDYFIEQPRAEVRHPSAAAAGATGGEQESVTLMDCIGAFTVEEILSEQDPWYCSRCKEFRQAKKKMDLWKLPNILIVHLKRFSYTRTWRDKISTFVDFPFNLDLSDIVVNPEEKSRAFYELYAVSNHMGGMGGGHYNAYVKNLVDGRWYCHDDSRVSRISPSDVKTSMAYVLFYRRRDPNAPPDAPVPGGLELRPMPTTADPAPRSAAGAGARSLAVDSPAADIEMEAVNSLD